SSRSSSRPCSCSTTSWRRRAYTCRSCSTRRSGSRSICSSGDFLPPSPPGGRGENEQHGVSPMNPGAGVTSLDVLNDWYSALAVYREEAQNALTSLALSLQHAAAWLHEQEDFWRRQIRVCEEEVTEAKAALANRKYVDFSGDTPDCTVQEDDLR